MYNCMYILTIHLYDYLIALRSLKKNSRRCAMLAIYLDIQWIIITMDLFSPSTRWVLKYFVAVKHVSLARIIKMKIDYTILVNKFPVFFILFSATFHNTSTFKRANIWTGSNNSTWYWCRSSWWLFNKYDFSEVSNEIIM